MRINYLLRNRRLDYYCGMRDELTSVFSKEVISEDGGHYFYAIQPFEMKNMLGAVGDVIMRVEICW